jgi:hypothetical protein
MQTETVELREAWLNLLAERVRPFMQTSANITFPDYRVSCGFPSRGGKSGKVVGECWAALASSDAHAEIFITPYEDNPEKVASTLVHELIHACLPKAGHRAPFQRAAKALGFEAPWRSTPETDVFWAWVRPIIAAMPPYPHGKLYNMRAVAAPAPQKGRLLKAECPSCGYTVRVTRKWVVEAGAPICPADKIGMAVELGEEGE